MERIESRSNSTPDRRSRRRDGGDAQPADDHISVHLTWFALQHRQTPILLLHRHASSELDFTHFAHLSLGPIQVSLHDPILRSHIREPPSDNSDLRT